jgi:UDP-N-acetylglucosamine acyltransferase
VTIGEGCRIGHGAHLEGHTKLGRRNVLYPFVSLGTPPQDLKYHDEPTELVIGDENTFREFFTANIGTTTGHRVTRIGNRNLMMISSHIGHDCVIEDDVILVNGVLVGGHCRIERGAKIMGGVGITPFATVGKMAYVTGMSGVARDAPPFMISEGRTARVRGVNEVGLRRAGYSDDVIQDLNRAYKRIFRMAELNRQGVLDRIEAEGDACEETLYLVSFLRRALQGRHGRYLEGQRKA